MIKRILRIGCFTVVIIFILLTIGASFFMLNLALTPNPGKQHIKAHYQLLYARHPEVKPWIDSLKKTKTLRDTFITMPSGERHHALYARYPNGSRHTAIVIHGWRNTAIDFLHIASFYYQQFGYNILLPDLHAHGLSEGETIGMGWKERFDVMRWMDLATTTFNSDSIVIHGVSMGAATAMNVSGEDMPASIKDLKFVEDCGYTSVWDEFDMRIGDDYSLPDIPLLYTSSLLCLMRNGWSFGEASPVSQLKECHYPMLFIHGDSDHFVPSWMVHVLYQAKPDKKRLWITKGADHNMSYFKYPKEYVATVRVFLDTNWQ